MSRLWGIPLLIGLCAITLSIAPAYAQGFGVEDAIASALKNAPELREAEARLGAADGERRQMSALPNPSFGFEAENVAGSGIYNGTGNMEATVSVSQIVELGGKRSARKGIAERGQDMARLNQSEARADIVRKVRIAYAVMMAAQESMALARAENDIAKDILNNVRRRVEAGGEPLHQRSKAQISLASSQLALAKAERDYEASTKVLERLTGISKLPSPEPDDFYAIAEPEKVAGDIQLTAAHQRIHQEIGQRKSALDLEKANAVPDPTISIGARNFRNSDDNALVFGVSLPLPVLNANRGNIQEASFDVAAAEAMHERSLRDSYTSLEERQYALEAAYEQAESMKEVMPEAENALKNARHGYDAGAFAYLDVLDAQRTLADAKSAYIAALRDYHINRAEIEFMTVPANYTETQQ